MTSAKNYRMKLEVASRPVICARCGKEIAAGVIFLHFGINGEEQTDFCADCFEDMSSQLSNDFQSLRVSGKVRAPVLSPVAAFEARCFTCGQRPENCRCGKEAYR